jgi:hypothetical protein
MVFLRRPSPGVAVRDKLSTARQAANRVLSAEPGGRKIMAHGAQPGGRKIIAHGAQPWVAAAN